MGGATVGRVSWPVRTNSQSDRPYIHFADHETVRQPRPGPAMRSLTVQLCIRGSGSPSSTKAASAVDSSSSRCSTASSDPKERARRR